jgi:alpha-galactosidase
MKPRLQYSVAIACLSLLLSIHAEGEMTNQEPVCLTPAAPAAPRINGPKIYGLRPGSPFLYRIPATGERPMTFGVSGLPEGLSLDGARGIITGRVAKAGTYRLTLSATNAFGHAAGSFRLVVGDKLALTPPMGWNSWYIHLSRVTELDMRKAADQMIGTGMADYGYQYVNIDDGWMKKRDDVPYRDDDGAVLPNAKFPDVPGLVKYIHDKGLKAGIYTSPGPWTCAHFVGAYEHEGQDARKFAEWGFDFLKYDWCSYSDLHPGKSLADFQKPYQQMSGELQKLDRDIILNLCQYGMANVWEWGGTVGQCWRTTGDLGAERSTNLPAFYKIGFRNAAHWQYARPGAWNDPDYLLLGCIAGHGGVNRPTTLSPDEQYSYMSLWCLMAAPLFFSGDMARLDAFTLNVLCNTEVNDVDQDALGRQGRIMRKNDDVCILLKDMEDGSKALGVFNLKNTPQQIDVAWSELGISGSQRLRDLWRQQDLGAFENRYTPQLPSHGVALVRLYSK